MIFALGLSLQAILRAVHTLVEHIRIFFVNRDLFLVLRSAEGGFSQVAIGRLLGLRTCERNFLSEKFNKLI